MGGPGVVNDILYDEFDNFFMCKIKYDGLEWYNSEQLYQALKFKDPAHRLKINKTKYTFDAYALGHKRKDLLIDNFEERKVDLMYEANYAKFSQNIDLAKILLSTASPIQFNASTRFWNIKNAENIMKIRTKLRGGE